jgi:hypothetical protein
LTVFGLLILFGLISLGILSTSIIIGINKKSFVKGFRYFIIISSTVFASLIFGTGFWILNRIQHWWAAKVAIISGGTIGLLSGLIFGFLLIYVLRWFSNYFKARFNI